MAKKLYERSNIQAIANALRNKCGTTCAYKTCDMAAAIDSIPTSGEGNENSIVNRTVINYENTSVPSIGDYVFEGCSNLISVNLPAVTSIGASAFSNSSLMNISLPNVTSIGASAFYKCVDLRAIDLPFVTAIDSYTFGESGLMNIVLPNALTIGPYAFNNCKSLRFADFSNVSKMDVKAFDGCSFLIALILRGNSVVQPLGTTPSDFFYFGNSLNVSKGYIYVPRALLDSYINSYRWYDVSESKFRALEDYTVDGTTTGDLRPDVL